MEIDRRDFLKTTGRAMTVGAATLALGGRIFGANDRVRLAICGLRGRGNDHLQGFATDFRNWASGRILAEDAPNQRMEPQNIPFEAFGALGIMTGLATGTELLG